MALVTCPQCSKLISSFALACPACGRGQVVGLGQASTHPQTPASGLELAHSTRRAELFCQNVERLHALFDPRLGPFAAEAEVTAQYVHAWMTLVRNHFSWDSDELQRQIAGFLAAYRTIGLPPNSINQELRQFSLQVAKSSASRVHFSLSVIFALSNEGVKKSLELGSQNWSNLSHGIRALLIKNSKPFELVVFQGQ